MRKNIGLTEAQIELLMKLLQEFVQILKVVCPKKFSTENDLLKISQYTELYEILAEQYYDKPKFLKKIS